MKGEDCCPLLQWIIPIDFCKNGLAARQTRLLLEKFMSSSSVMVGPHHPNLSSNNSVCPAVLEELSQFLLRDDVSRPSSCMSVIVDGQETPVRYWTDSIKILVNQYLLEFHNGVKRTYIYSHLPPSFRSDNVGGTLQSL